MWGYYGSKSKIVKRYPKPMYDKIIEPFAGTAQYSLKYFEKDILLIEKYEVVARLWKWLQRCSEKDILGLPRLKWGDRVDDFTWDCEEAKWLVGFIITGSPTHPKKTATKWRTVDCPTTQDYKLKMISESLYKIRHWNIIQGDYSEVVNDESTWFIDPPYQFGGKYYKHGNRKIDYNKLANWCKDRKGQVIVCENSKADWLEFNPLVEINGNKHKTIECCYIKNSSDAE